VHSPGTARKSLRGLEVEHHSLRAFCDLSPKGGGGGSFTGDPEGYVEKVGVMIIFVNTDPVEKPERGPCTGDFEI
jgi:hypothetical protein